MDSVLSQPACGEGRLSVHVQTRTHRRSLRESATSRDTPKGNPPGCSSDRRKMTPRESGGVREVGAFSSHCIVKGKGRVVNPRRILVSQGCMLESSGRALKEWKTQRVLDFDKSKVKAIVLLFLEVRLKSETFPSYQRQKWNDRKSSIQRNARKERKRNTAQKYSSTGSEQEGTVKPRYASDGILCKWAKR